MKKILLVLGMLVVLVGSLFAVGGGEGTVAIQPATAITSQTGIAVGMTLTAGGTAYVAGTIVIDIPTGWSAPSLSSVAPGYVSAVASEGDDLVIAVE
jgi:hypothetical protein